MSVRCISFLPFRLGTDRNNWFNFDIISVSSLLFLVWFVQRFIVFSIFLSSVQNLNFQFHFRSTEKLIPRSENLQETYSNPFVTHIVYLLNVFFLIQTPWSCLKLYLDLIKLHIYIEKGDVSKNSGNLSNIRELSSAYFIIRYSESSFVIPLICSLFCWSIPSISAHSKYIWWQVSPCQHPLWISRNSERSQLWVTADWILVLKIFIQCWIDGPKLKKV